MALTFNNLEAVQFGDKVCQPKVNGELRRKLELELVSGGDKDADEQALDTIAQCFPENEEYVRAFLRDSMSTTNIKTLHVYLIDGDAGLARLEKAMEATAKAKAEVK